MAAISYSTHRTDARIRMHIVAGAFDAGTRRELYAALQRHERNAEAWIAAFSSVGVSKGDAHILRVYADRQHE